MKVTHDVPGDRLTLEGQAPRIPPGAPAVALIALCLPFVYQTLRALPAALGPDGESSQKIAAAALLLFWCGLFFSAARSIHRGARWPTGLDADRNRGELRLAQCGLLGRARREEIVPLERIAGLTVRRTVKAPSLHDPRRPQAAGPGLALTFQIGREGTTGESRSLAVGIEHLDRPEEVVDLALRLGAATGLPFFRIVRNDARDVEVALRHVSDVGFNPVPRDLGQADYARDTVAPAARAAVAEEHIPPFEPQTFPSDYKVAAWTPGVEVEFRKPVSFAAIGCLPFTLLVLTGPAIFPFVRGTGAGGDGILGRLFVSAFLGLFGAIFGVIAIAAVVSGLPRRVRIDWTARTIRIWTLFKTTVVPFESVKVLEMKVVHRVQQGKTPRHYHFCEVGLHVKSPPPGTTTYEALLESERFRDDPDPAYKASLPLATELARSLGAERRITDAS